MGSNLTSVKDGASGDRGGSNPGEKERVQDRVKFIQQSWTTSERTKNMDAVVNSLLASDCKIFGSYVYKRVILGEEANDIDCICGDVDKTLKKLEGLYSFESSVGSEEEWAPSSRNLKLKGIGFEVDIIPQIAVTSFSRDTFLNIPVFTRKGIEHYKGESILNRIQLDFMIENLSERRYCPWLGMRPKDREFFKGFTEIDPERCKKYNLGKY